MSVRDEYRELCRDRSDIPIFSTDWWLDAVCLEGSWEVYLAKKGGQIWASMPVVFRKKFGIRIASSPPLTPWLGPWIRYPQGQKTTSALAHEKSMLERLLEQVPEVSWFGQNWYYTQTNWLPFYWKGYDQTTKYSYRYRNLDDPEELWSRLTSDRRREVRRAREAGVTASEEGKKHLPVLHRLVEKTFQAQGRSVPFSEQLLRRVDEACRARDKRSLLVARGEDGEPYAACYLVRDGLASYLLLQGSDPEWRSTYANSLLTWTAVEHAAETSGVFDFEGSMVPGIERFYREFGADLCRYFYVQKKTLLGEIGSLLLGGSDKG